MLYLTLLKQEYARNIEVSYLVILHRNQTQRCSGWHSSFWVVPGSVLALETGCITSLSYPCFHFPPPRNHCRVILERYRFPSHILISSLLIMLRFFAITLAVDTVAYEYTMK